MNKRICKLSGSLLTFRRSVGEWCKGLNVTRANRQLGIPFQKDTPVDKERFGQWNLSPATGRLRIVLTGLLVSILVVIGVGCALESQPKATEKIKLSFRHVWIQEHNAQMLKIVSEVIKQFELDHPNVRIDFEGLDQTVHREQRLKSEMVTGNIPDIFVLFSGAEIEPYARAGRLMDLTDFLKENRMDNGFYDLSLWRFGSGVYGLPIEGFAEPVYYNKQLFAELGLSVPTNWEQLVQVINKLKSAGLVPFSLGNQERWPGAMHYHYFLQRFAGSAPIDQIVKGKGSFINADYEQATQRFIEFAKLNPFPTLSETRSIAYAEKLFLEGKAGMFLNGSWELNLFQGEQSTPGFADKVGVFNFPVLSGTKEASVGLASGYTFGLGLSANLEGEHRKAALDLIKAIYAPDVQRRIVYESFRLPAMKIAVDYGRTGPVFKQIIDLLETSPSAFVPYDNALPPALQEPFFQVAEQLIAGNVSAQEALQRLEIQLQQYYELVGQ
ncbi:raffinose/stachyose/melibiose transport system substrate-binding protein [Paenibacillus sp. 1_12]|uniref:ABC transporter substrate-binding protein n=1 Tax=Paenibacillus sp. 1_12 TaxID=1566278 RepID=UPI0008E0BE05|nr:extracellular solute-binding protein [Paenibacillus sp. 1_12]SFL25743.1 raffinose/stachyose/melibiose transport system substrate-binding protein [Paenibacillus sp. 1_12]